MRDDPWQQLASNTTKIYQIKAVRVNQDVIEDVTADNQYTTSDERDLAMSWVTSYAQATGIQQQKRVKLRDGIGPRVEPRWPREGGDGGPGLTTPRSTNAHHEPTSSTYLPTPGLFAVRPSTRGADIIQQFKATSRPSRPP